MIFGAVLMMLSGVAIVGSKAIISRAAGAIDQENLLGGAGKAGSDLKGPIDLLLLGVDVRKGWDKNDTRPDTMIILHIPAAHDRAYLVSLPRDTEVQIPPAKNGFKGAVEKLNSAFYFGAQNGGGWAGGTELLARTIKNATGISFDGAAIIDFNGFKGVIDALGTINVCVDQKVSSHHMMLVDGKLMYITDAQKSGRPYKPVTYEPGCQDMKGWQALDFSRQRYGLKNGDYDRQRHQQQVIKAIAKKAMAGGVMTNPVKVNNLVKAAGKAFTLDTNGVPIQDFIFTMRGVTANDLTLLRTNAGKFNSHKTNGESREALTPESIEMFRAVKSDKLADFIKLHPDFVAPKA
ncbi:LCP family protein [Plantactinospora siamensis]|uniref:LCP family protein n=1 Tax=Plantactinospora siamensis TaxID=555372 RepID=A0ABV6NQI0_9ACTN